ncbi:SH3 domain protein [Scheffersomyces amazonensis]|uniref:SH3 domain protein n=1 Tax=Scheffersomyces amazonensis TaxID=1078765 RepID=UPI00315D6390
MSSLYIGVYKALYEYTAQADEELTLQPDDILYLLEKSEIDEWWKVKKRVLPVGDEEVDEPVGLVPSNYIESAPILKTATAVFDYDKQTEEELSFTEGEKFNVYDLNDPDWILVGNIAQTQFGFIPSNYIELDSGATTSSIPVPSQSQPLQPQLPISAFAPPPLHRDRSESAPPEPVAQAVSEPAAAINYSYEPSPQKLPQRQEQYSNHYEEEEAPPMPSRPGTSSNLSPVVNLNKPQPELPINESPGTRSGGEKVEDLHQEHSFDGEFFTWYIDEVDGRKKKPVVFSIGQGLVIIRPNNKDNDNQWRLKDLIDFNQEKKHVFLDLKNPKVSIELHCGTRDVAEAISSILGDLKGAEHAKGLKEIAKASQATTNEKNKKIGRLIYDFEAQGRDELMSREGDEVYIVDESKSKDWWYCENIETGKQGVIPSAYIEIIGTSNLDKLTDGVIRQKSTKSSKGKLVENNGKSSDKKSHHHRSRDERERIREKDKAQRDKKLDSPSKKDDKSGPNLHRVRTWIDSSGSFKVEAEFLGCIEGKIHLHKTNGVKIAVAATKLSVEDLEYVEKVTGTSLKDYIEEVEKQQQKRAKAAAAKQQSQSQSQSQSHTSSSGSGATAVQKTHSATATINDIPPPQPARPKTTTKLTTSEPDYDWFEFFLQCGVDIGNCQRYSLNFGREQMDENILEDISPTLLRTLGLREGDIIRVMKFLDNKFDRKKSTTDGGSTPSGSLFVDPNGALKNNNSSTDIPKVSADSLPSASATKVNNPEPPKIDHLTTTSKFEDDAWAVKPAARSSEDLSKPSSQPQTPQYTGALQDLVDIKPAGSSTNIVKSVPAPTPSIQQGPSAPALTPVKTGTLIQPGQQFTIQKTNNIVAPQVTGGLVPVQKTGLIPIPTGGILASQPTGFMPITAQPTGFLPIQQTGLQPQLTFGIVPLQTGGTTFNVQKTGGILPPQLTGGIPITSFNQAPPSFVPAQLTGGLPPTSFGQVPAQRTGGGLPPTTFGQVPAQRTGGFVPQSAFGQQITGGFVQQQTTSFGNPPISQAPTSFGFGQAPPQPIASNPFGFGQPQPQPQPQPQFQQQQQPQPQAAFATGFGQPQPQPTFVNGFGQPSYQTGFNQFPAQQTQQPGFNQPDVNQLNNMFQQTSINPAQAQFPNTSFGQQPQFEGFGGQPLQNQPTGVGFGNAPLQSQQTGGRRANLSAATPDNPFGF